MMQPPFMHLLNFIRKTNIEKQLMNKTDIIFNILGMHQLNVLERSIVYNTS